MHEGRQCSFDDFLGDAVFNFCGHFFLKAWDGYKISHRHRQNFRHGIKSRCYYFFRIAHAEPFHFEIGEKIRYILLFHCRVVRFVLEQNIYLGGIPLVSQQGHLRLLGWLNNRDNMRNDIATPRQANEGTDTNLVVDNEFRIEAGRIFDFHATQMNRFNLHARLQIPVLARGPNDRNHFCFGDLVG